MAKCEVVQMNMGISTGNQTIKFSRGFGIPIGAIFFFCRATVVEDLSAQAELGIGVIDGTRQYALAWVARTNQATSITRKFASKTACLLIINANNGQINGEAEFVSFGEDEIVINFTDAMALNWTYNVMAWSGEELTIQAGLIFTGSDLHDTDTVGLPFKLDQLFTFGERKSFDDIAQGNLHMSIGIADRNEQTDVIKQMGWALHDQNLQVTETSESMLSTTGLLTTVDIPNVEAHFVLDNITDTSFDIVRTSADDPSSPAPSTGEYAYLAISYSGALDHDIFMYNTAAEITVQETGALGFRPQAGLQFGPQFEEIGVKQLDGTFVNSHMIGMFGLSGQNIPDVLDPTFNSRYMSYSHGDDGLTAAETVFTDVGPALHTIAALPLISGEFVQFTNEGMDISWIHAPSTSYSWPTLAVGLRPRSKVITWTST